MAAGIGVESRDGESEACQHLTRSTDEAREDQDPALTNHTSVKLCVLLLMNTDQVLN